MIYGDYGVHISNTGFFFLLPSADFQTRRGDRSSTLDEQIERHMRKREHYIIEYSIVRSLSFVNRGFFFNRHLQSTNRIILLQTIS